MPALDCTPGPRQQALCPPSYHAPLSLFPPCCLLHTLRGERGITAAVILACATGNWMEELNECLGHELDEPDANGYTPLMHALMFGKTQIVRNLIDMGVDCSEPVRRA